MPDKTTVLFIDDDPLDRTLIERLLDKHDFHVLMAEESQTGMRLAQEHRPAVIILDILLPGVSGIEICKKLRKIPETANIPIIFYTSIDTPKHLIDYSSYGAQDYVQKTMPPEELINAVKTALKIHSKN